MASIWTPNKCACGGLPREPLPFALKQRAHDGHGEQLLALVRDDQLLEREPYTRALARGKGERLAAIGREDYAIK